MGKLQRIALLAPLIWVGSVAIAQSLGPAPVVAYQPPQPSPSQLLDVLRQATPPPITLQPDDVVMVQVLGIDELALKEQRINSSGMLSYPFIGPLPVEGKTLHQVEQMIAEGLVRERLIKDPQVTVTAVNLPSRTISVAGEVNKAGVFPAYGAQSISTVIGLAQGLSATASDVVLLRRPGMIEPVAIPIGPDFKASAYGDIPVFAGDSVQVQKLGVVYSVGAFKTQGAYPIKRDTPLTTTQLIAMSQGMGYEASAKDAQIVRVENGKYVLIPIRLDKILKGQQADLSLKNDDVLFVPSNNLKAAIKGGGTGIVISLVSAFLYLH